MALAAAGGGDRTLSDASLHFRFTATAPTERHHSRNITWAQPLVMPSAHVAHAPILY